MIALIDGGATKADWSIVTNGKPSHSFRTKGLSPFFMTQHEIASEIKTELPKSISPEAVNQVYFFGTGCSSPERIEIVRAAFHSVFRNATCNISNDMHGAALALYDKSQGIAAILGTGMNSCYWNGSSIDINPPSLGYILGDEGSGAHLGTSIIKAYLNKELPADVYQLFAMEYPNLSRSMILDAVYRQARPNAYLAQYAYFLGKHKQHPYIQNIITNCFDLFFQKQISKYPSHISRNLRCIGSVAFFLEDSLREVALRHSVTIDLVVKAPIDLLTTVITKQNGHA